jgi:hypothetical protein
MNSDTQQHSGASLPASDGSEFRVRITRVSVLPIKEPLFSEQCTNVSIVDEACGEFLEIEQQSGRTDAKSQTILVEPKEWPALKQAIEQMLAECETENVQAQPRGTEERK